MKTKAAISLIGTFIGLILLTILITAEDSFAHSRDRKYEAPHNRYNKSVIVRQRTRHAPERILFNKGGGHYRSYWSGFYGNRARATYGRPYGYIRPWPRTSAYISLSGIFYQSPPANYVVVKTPPETVVIRETSTAIRPLESATGYVLVTVSTLNVRTGPDLGYSLVSQVSEGSILKIQARMDDWSYVKLPDGRFGWVKSVFIEPLEPGSS